jgi:uncharacterized protein (TIGR01777 family)
MKIVLAGGSGFLGRALTRRLVDDGHDVVVLTRQVPDSATRAARAPTTARDVPWDPDGTTGVWAREIEGADAVVNLAGAGIADKRWTRARKELIRSSRVLSTRSLATAMREASTRPSTFIQGSAVGFYGSDLGDRVSDEASPPGSNVLSDICVAWEAEAHPIAALGTRLVFVRTGLVLAREGGALPQIELPFKFFVGGRLASGRQYFSWIHRDDWINLMVWAISTPSVSGVLNGTAPGPVTNDELSRALGRALHRPSWLPVPAFALRMLVGEFADVGLVTGNRVVPTRPQQLGFTFAHPTIEGALASL